MMTQPSTQMMTKQIQTNLPLAYLSFIIKFFHNNSLQFLYFVFCNMNLFLYLNIDNTLINISFCFHLKSRLLQGYNLFFRFTLALGKFSWKVLYDNFSPPWPDHNLFCNACYSRFDTPCFVSFSSI